MIQHISFQIFDYGKFHSILQLEMTEDTHYSGKMLAM